MPTGLGTERGTQGFEECQRLTEGIVSEGTWAGEKHPK